MLSITTTEFILLLKDRGNTKYRNPILEDRMRNFIADKYLLEKVSDERILIELEMAFLEVVHNVEKQEICNLIEQFLKMQKDHNTKYAYITSLMLLRVQNSDNGDFFNGFDKKIVDLIHQRNTVPVGLNKEDDQ